jgi:hypothetical protein
MPMAQDIFPLDDPVFSQLELCEVAEITMTTANNWIMSGALYPAQLKIRRARKPRLFSINMIFQAKITAKVVEEFGGSPSTAAAVARAMTAQGHDWMQSVARDVEDSRIGKKKRFHNFYAAVFWSNDCRDFEALLLLASATALEIELNTIAKREPRFADRPLLVMQVSNDFASVYEKCTEIYGVEDAANGGER